MFKGVQILDGQRHIVVIYIQEEIEIYQREGLCLSHWVKLKPPQPLPPPIPPPFSLTAQRLSTFSEAEGDARGRDCTEWIIAQELRA